jgi:hypothetical protein
MGAEVEITRREIELFVVSRIIRDMHFAVVSGDLASIVNYQRRIMINARCSPLKDRRHDDDFARCRELAEALGCRPGDRLGEIEHGILFRLAKVTRAKQLLQANQAGPARRRFLNSRLGPLEINRGCLGACHLDQPDGNFVRFHLSGFAHVLRSEIAVAGG